MKYVLKKAIIKCLIVEVLILSTLFYHCISLTLYKFAKCFFYLLLLFCLLVWIRPISLKQLKDRNLYIKNRRPPVVIYCRLLYFKIFHVKGNRLQCNNIFTINNDVLIFVLLKKHKLSIKNKNKKIIVYLIEV